MMDFEVHDLLAYDGLKIVQGRDLFRFSLDSLLLGDFVNINPRYKRIIDLGCGNAPIPLFLSLKTDKPIIGVDIQDEAVELARQSVAKNNLEDQIEIVQADIKNLYKMYPTNCFDLVIANPPFFKYHNDQFLNSTDNKTISRHEVLIDLEGVIKSATQLISNGGSFNMIHRANRLEEIILMLDKYRFVIKRMRFVYTQKDKDALMVLIDARANGNKGDIKILKPLFVYEDKNIYSEEIKRIFHFGEDKYGKKI